jgi:fructokinase
MKIEPVSTIGAGDNFNAGVIASLYSMDASPSSIVNLGQAEWDKIIGTAIEFASEVCLSYDNYIGLPFASRYRSASRLQM